MFEEKLILFFAVYPWLLCLVGIFIGGEETAIFLAALAGQGVYSIYIVLIFGFIGIMLSDLMWFFVGRSKHLGYLKKYKLAVRAYGKARSFMEKFSGKNDFLLLLYTKFVYGARVAAIIHLGRKRVKFFRFLYYNFFVDVIWILVVCLVGLLTGKVFSLFLNLYKDFVALVVALYIVVLLVYIFRKFIGKKISGNV